MKNVKAIAQFINVVDLVGGPIDLIDAGVFNIDYDSFEEFPQFCSIWNRIEAANECLQSALDDYYDYVEDCAYEEE